MTAHLVWESEGDVIGRPRRDATEVIDAYRALEARLEPFTVEFDKPVARISESPTERQQRDVDVAEIVDELTELTKKVTAKLLTAATRAARRHRRRAAGDEDALAEALDSLAARFGPVEQMVLTAEATLDLALRVVLARLVIGSYRPQTDPATSATGGAVYCEPPYGFAGWRLEAIVDNEGRGVRPAAGPRFAGLGRPAVGLSYPRGAAVGPGGGRTTARVRGGAPAAAARR